MTQIELMIGQVGSPQGDLLVVFDGAGRLYSCDFADTEPRLHRLLDRRLGQVGYHLLPGAVPEIISGAFTRYFTGELTAIDGLEVVCSGTEFQRLAWDALRQIPAGQTASYAEQAARIGRPGASRAVGSANHNNPVNIVVPCHRVIGASGALTGYAGGLERKRWLLDHEDRHANHHGRLI